MRRAGIVAQGGAAWLAAGNARLGPSTPGQRNELVVFGAAVCCWLIPGVLTLIMGADTPAIRSFNARMPESMVALCAAPVLFARPLDWREARFKWAGDWSRHQAVIRVDQRAAVSAWCP